MKSWKRTAASAALFMGVGAAQVHAIAEDDARDNVMSYEGINHDSGGNDPNAGLDSAGFVHYIFNEYYNVSLPRWADDQRQVGERISKQNAREGDMVFFQGGTSVMSGIMISSDSFLIVTSSGVEERSFQHSYYQDRFLEVRRITPEMKDADVMHGAAEEVGAYPSSSHLTSEFVQDMFSQHAGIDIPRLARDQMDEGRSIAKEDLLPGDIVHFQGSGLMSGIYAGNDEFFVVTSSGVQKNNLETSSYWAPRFEGGTRYFNEDGEALADFIGENSSGRTSAQFVRDAFADLYELDIPASSNTLIETGSNVQTPDLQAGDLVFFQGSGLMTGIYMQNGEFLINLGGGVTTRNMFEDSYYKNRYLGANRLSESSLGQYARTNVDTTETVSLLTAPHSSASTTYTSSNTEMEVLDVQDGWAEVFISGNRGFVPEETLDMYPVSDASYRNEYRESGDYLVHEVYDEGTYQVGAFPDHLDADEVYHTTEGYLIDGVESYQYFNYLPVRSSADVTGEELNSYVASVVEDSPLAGLGDVFVEEGEEHDLNPMFILGVAIHESGFGTSAIAQDHNNLFGLNATDEDPYENAEGFDSMEDSINHFSEFFIQGYLDTDNWRYENGIPGNKGRGFNVRYASDPHWGQKIAGHMMRMDNYIAENFNNGETEHGKYEIGMVEQGSTFYASAGGTDVDTNNRKDRVVAVVGREGNYIEVYADTPDRSTYYIHESNYRELPTF